ncbi:MAG: 2Fe-2S ferredoxin [Rhodospirillaceae bacterium]|nr:2Fe-2S ferredoxin [Rhodospirillaceae bacterium]|tara:strand:+ start:2174 stop:2587 length:414 start_codon:yes stop_codon:yes gene_type:complete
MPKYVVAAIDEILPGERKLVQIRGRPIVIFNLDGEYFGILDRCPHQGASLCQGKLVGLVEALSPGSYTFSRKGEIIRCPWHGWEFDIRTGQSRCEPNRIKATKYDIQVSDGKQAREDSYIAETFDVSVDDQYVVVNV